MPKRQNAQNPCRFHVAIIGCLLGILYLLAPVSSRANLAISPLVNEMDAYPGGAKTFTVGVSNTSDKALDCTVTVSGLEILGSGMPVAVEDAPRSCSGWIEIKEDRFTLGPGEGIHSMQWTGILDAGKYDATLTMRYDPKGEVLSDISSQTGRTIIPDQSVQGMISCELNDVPLKEALSIVLSVGDYDFKEMDGYILVGSTAPDGPSFMRLCQSKIVKLSYLKAEEAITLLPTALRKYTTASKTNMISVMAPSRMLDTIVDILNEYDQAPNLFLLDARIVVIEMGNLMDMGVQWDWPSVEAGAFSNSDLHGLAAPAGAAQWPWGLQIGYTPDKEFTNNLMMTLNMLTMNDEATVTANPQVMAQEGEEASINVTTEEYFEIRTRGYYTNSELEKITAGTLLEITPHLGNGDEITLKLRTEVSDVVARGENNLPVVTRREASSTVRIHDGGTAVIGGLTDNRTRAANEWVPYLGRIPLVGRLFRNDAQNVNTRQIAIFLTAHLLKERDEVEKPQPRIRIPAYQPVPEKEFRIRLQEQLNL